MKTGNYVRDIDALNTRIISLNTESCDFKNLYIDSAENDPNNEIKYLIENLDELEKAGKLAIIVGHIPDECSRQYQQRFRAILERYQKTVRLNLFGHTHRDIFKVVSSTNKHHLDPIGVLTVCGSITSFLVGHPSYCVYELDKETMLPVSRQTYFFDLDEANASGTPEWKLHTDWTEDYEMADLSPSEYASLASRISASEDTAKQFIDNASRTAGETESCDSTCRNDTFCESMTLDPKTLAFCRGDKYYDWTGNFLSSLRFAMQDQWVREVDQTPEIQTSEFIN